jgi:hypothetical protein
MRNLAMSASGAALLLAACSSSDAVDTEGEGAVPAAEVAGAAADMPKPEPGLYRTTITMTGIDIPGMGPNMAGHGGGMTTTNENCLTPEEVSQGYEEMVKRGQDGSCSYERFNVAGGRLDAVMVCQSDQGEARMEMKGTATATGSEFDATMAMDLDGRGNGTMRFNAKHERIGDCPQ